ncbi:hypothetical protein G9A89_016099 [Geosiphon pyriformis]|nr:hypothetical protein G9A89_016099 [Geosiphon pyriformis]
MESGSSIGVKFVESRKKKRGGVLEDSIGNKKVAAMVLSGHFWSSKTDNTTELNSVDIEKEFLVEETSFDYGEGGTFTDRNLEQTPKSSKIQTKRALSKPLRKIDFLSNDSNNIFLDNPVVFSPSLKNLVNILVQKSFAMNIKLDKVVKKSSQEKLVVVRKLFSKVNGFGRASILSKFLGIIYALFTSESNLAQATKKTRAKILIETLAKAVCTKAVVEFKQLDHADLVTAKWSILIGKDVMHVKTCVINYHSVTYIWVRCTVVCFNFAESLDTAIRTTPVFRSINLHWASFVSIGCAKCGKLGHILLSCAKSGKISSGSLLHRVLSDVDKNRLAAIYAK